MSLMSNLITVLYISQILLLTSHRTTAIFELDVGPGNRPPHSISIIDKLKTFNQVSIFFKVKKLQHKLTTYPTSYKRADNTAYHNKLATGFLECSL